MGDDWFIVHIAPAILYERHSVVFFQLSPGRFFRVLVCCIEKRARERSPVGCVISGTKVGYHLCEERVICHSKRDVAAEEVSHVTAKLFSHFITRSRRREPRTEFRLLQWPHLFVRF